jgi:hypothetical protein
LELVSAGAIVDGEVLYWLEIEMDAFYLFQFGIEPCDHSCDVDTASGEWFEVDLDAPTVKRCVCSVYSNERRKASDGRVFENNSSQLLLF